MADLILYMAKSGSGKTSSLRNLPVENTIFITPNSKSLPFPGGDVNYNSDKGNRIVTNKLNGDPSLPTDDFRHYSIESLLDLISENKPEIKYIVLDDFTHFFSARIFSQEFLDSNTGNAAFQRWNQFGADVFQALFQSSDKLRDDLYIIILHHTELKEDGLEGFKSPGKLLDNTIDVPSYFNYILHGLVRDVEGGTEYVIQTNKTSHRHAKTPYGMFKEDELYVPNDMNAIINRIEAYKKGELKIEWK